MNKKIGAWLVGILWFVPITAHEPTWLLRSSDTLNKQRNILAGWAASLISSHSFTLLFNNISEDFMFKLSEIKAKRVFWNAYASVPAYQDYINKRGPTALHTFSDIPLTNKTDYIENYPIEQTIKGGKIPFEGNVDQSSGTSGRRTLWIRGTAEIKNTQRAIYALCNTFLDKEPHVIINMLLPCAWSIGLMHGLGPNISEAYETMKDLGSHQKYLIMGHASLMKHFVRTCPFDLAQYDVTFLINGEHISRALQKSFIAHGVKKVYASYGASDINSIIGIQEEFAQKLQELCWNNVTIKQDLTGSENGLPYFFQYNPLNNYIEEINGHLILTDLDHMRLSPRVRYDPGDKGKILKMSFVQEILQKHAIQLTPKAHYPLLCLYGRADDIILFDNAELAFDDLELAILNIPALSTSMNRYAYNQLDTLYGPCLEFWVELKPNLSATQFDCHTLAPVVFIELGNINQIFKRAIEQAQTKPILKIYDYGKSPMIEESPLRKTKYVYHLKHAPLGV